MQHNEMMYQPSDVGEWTFDEGQFNTLNAYLSFRDDSFMEPQKLQSSAEEQSAAMHATLFEEDIVDKAFDDTEYSCTTPVLAPAYDSNMPLPEDLDDSEIIDPFKDPINEITIETNPENTSIGITSLGINSTDIQVSTLEDIETTLIQFWERLNLQKIDESIEERTMFVEKQPPSNLRPRYKSDGPRQIEKARTKPMVINLPNLKQIKLENREAFCIRLSLITANEDPSAQQYLHVNGLEYHSDDAQELIDGTVCVLLTPDDIQKGIKALPRLSIVRTKLGSFKSKLTPYFLTENNSIMHSATINSENLTAKRAKKLFQRYNMKASRIACQLLINQNETHHYTDITCATDIIYEKEQTRKRTLPTDVSDEEEEDDDDQHPSSSRPSKRRKTSRS